MGHLRWTGGAQINHTDVNGAFLSPFRSEMDSGLSMKQVALLKGYGLPEVSMGFFIWQSHLSSMGDSYCPACTILALLGSSTLLELRNVCRPHFPI